MSRRLVALPHRRPTRSRVPSRRFEHGHDLVALAPRVEPARPADAVRDALIAENATLARELGRAQQRCTDWRDRCVEQAERLEGQLVRARATAIVRLTELAVLRDAFDALRSADVPPAIHLSARAVLCVGGRARQVPVYRELVERHGGRFLHVGGTAQDGRVDLERHLAEADLVILQAGYACEDACRAVESHCARTGTRCVWLDKPCVVGFMRGLSDALGL